ncbi:MAG: class I SAM-dependent methyltransferase [Roseburia sp.]|jgi:hypothetical protein|nr:class I SAM-dependent methyltransferase [Roseburia sp.]
MDKSMQTVWETKREDVIKEMLRLNNTYELGRFRTIELYGGDGHTLSDKMAELSESFIGYDINPEKEEGFKKNVPNGEFRCGDSVKMMKEMKDGEIGTFNLISMDAPICIYGDDYCEHFEIVRYTYKLLSPGEKVLCVFPVVRVPYDTEKEENHKWMLRRGEFYETKEVILNLDEIYGIYTRLFEEQGMHILSHCNVCREYRNGVDWMYEYMYVMQK